MTATGRRARALRATTAMGVAAGLLVATAACTGSSGSAAPRTTGPRPIASSSPVTLSGKLAVDPDIGVRFQLPVGWRQVPIGNGQTQALQRLIPSVTEVNVIEQQMRVGQSRGMRVFAIRPHGSATPDSISLSIAQAQTTTLTGLQSMLKLATTRLAADTPQFRTVQLPAGSALRVHYRLVNGDTTTQYYLIGGGLAYTLTETTVASSGAATAQADAPVTDAVARTLRLSPTA